MHSLNGRGQLFVFGNRDRPQANRRNWLRSLLLSSLITLQNRCTTGCVSDHPTYTVCIFNTSTDIYKSLNAHSPTSGTPFTARSNCSHVNSDSAFCGTSAYTPAAIASAACFHSLMRYSSARS